MQRLLVVLFASLALLVSSAHPQHPSDFENSTPNRESKKVFLISCSPSFYTDDSPYINEEHLACLDEVALQLTEDSERRVVIDGHRDWTERKGMSLTRANFARRYLKEERGISDAQIVVRNFADSCPQLMDEQVANRRVEYWILAKGVDISELDALKQCLPGAQPKVVTDEKPARWKGNYYCCE